MKKLLLGLFIFVSFAICSHIYASSLELVSIDSGKSFNVTGGQTIKVTLSNPGDGGASFDAPIYDNTILQLVNNRHINPVINTANPVVGNFGSDYWEFVAIKSGNTNLKITASQPWSGGGTTTMFSANITVSTTTTPSIVITSPNNGGESVEVGGKIEIRWMSPNITSALNEIYISDGIHKGHTEGIRMENYLGSLIYTLDSNLIPGSNYKAYVSTAYGSAISASDSSDQPFTIKNITICPQPPSLAQCPTGTTGHLVYDTIGCVTGQVCNSTLDIANNDSTPTTDLTPRISFWLGKVNQHVDIASGSWKTDPDGVSGGHLSTEYSNDYGDRMVEYCQKFYPNIVGTVAYKAETINTWKSRGNVGNAIGTNKMSYKCTTSVLSSFFKIKITKDSTSSGATRKFESILTFSNDELISGLQKYYVGEGGGCTINCEHNYSCVIKDQKWIDSTSGTQCTINVYFSVAKSDIENDIKNKVIKPVNECGHLDTCYEMLQSDSNNKIHTSITRTLKWGIRGDDLKRLQDFLGLKSDGVFGRGTLLKVKEWQIKNGLFADGVFGARSQNKWNK